MTVEDKEEMRMDKFYAYIRCHSRRIQRIVLSLEKRLPFYIQNSEKEDIRQELSGCLAIMLSWTFAKQKNLHFGLWCDGIIIERYDFKTPHTFTFSGIAWMGNRADIAGAQWKSNISAEITLNTVRKKVKKYVIQIEEKTQVITFKKR